jgi:hypothetical protein
MKKRASILTAAVLTAALAVPFSTSAEETLIYGTMNIPYADFYAAELQNNDVPVDAVSSATTSKWKANQTGSLDAEGKWTAGGLAAGTYNDGEGAILGVTYPVAVSQADLEKIPESYAFTQLSEAPKAYKPVTVQDGVISFGKIEDTDGTDTIESDVTLSVTAWMGDYELTVANSPQDCDLYGVIVTTSDGKQYGLRSLENIWRRGEIAWTTGVKLKESHGNTLNPNHYADMQGKTVSEITYLTLDGYKTVGGLNIYLPLKTVESLTVESGKSGNGSVTFDNSVLPAAYVQSGKVAEGFTVDGGTITYENAAPGSYTLTMSDNSGMYADVTGTFTLTTVDVPVQFADGKLTAADGFADADAANFIKNINAVQIDENTYKTGHHGVTIIDSATGAVKWDAVANKEPVFTAGETYTLTVSATGYENTFTFEAKAEAPEETTVPETTAAPTETTAAVTETTAVSETAPAEDFATLEEFAHMAKIDYEKKQGIAVTPEAVQNADGSVTVTLKDANGTVLDTYTLDVKTGVGKNAQGAEVNLPQTGNNAAGTLAAVSGAALTALAGALMVCRAFRKKKED